MPPLINVEMYEALLDANASEEKARAAAAQCVFQTSKSGKVENVSDLKTKAVSLETDAWPLKTKVRSLETDAETLKRNERSLERDIKFLKKQVDRSETDARSLKTKVSRLETKIFMLIYVLANVALFGGLIAILALR